MQRYICSDCGHDQPTDGSCSRCGDGPVLDTETPGVVASLVELDVQAGLKRRQQNVWIALPVGLALGAMLSLETPLLSIVPLPIPFGNLIKGVVFTTVLTAGLAKAVTAVRPHRSRFPQLALAPGAVEAAPFDRGRYRPLLIGLGVLVALGIVVGGLQLGSETLIAGATDEKNRASEQALDELAVCLEVGAIPPSAEEMRSRLIAKDIAGEINWPASCADEADALFESTADHKEARGLRHWMSESLGCVDGCAFSSPEYAVGALFEQASKVGLSWEPAPPFEAPGPLLTNASFAAVGEPVAQLRDQKREGKVDSFLFATLGQGHQVCTADADEARLACRSVELLVAPSAARLVRGADAVFGIASARVIEPEEDEESSPALFDRVETEIEVGAFDFGGAPVDVWVNDDRTLGLYDGVAVVVEDATYRAVIVRAGESETALLEETTSAHAIGEIVYSMRDGLVAQTIAGDDELSDPVELGEGNLSLRDGRECVSDAVTWHAFGSKHAATLVRVTASDLVRVPQAGPARRFPSSADAGAKPEDARPGDGGLANAGLLADAQPMLGGWVDEHGRDVEGIMGAGGLGDIDRRAAIPSDRFTCSDEDATLTWVRVVQGGFDVHELRCDEAGCEHRIGEVREVRAEKVWVAASLDDGVAVLWRSELGDVRLRVAPLEALADTHDESLFDDEERGGPSTGSLQFSATRGGLIAMFQGDSMLGFHVDASGDVTVLGD